MQDFTDKEFLSEKIQRSLNTENLDEFKEITIDIHVQTIMSICETYLEEPRKITNAQLVAIILPLLTMLAADAAGELTYEALKNIQEGIQKTTETDA